MSTVRQQLGGDLLNVHSQAATIGGDLLSVHGQVATRRDLLNVHSQVATRRGFTKCPQSGGIYGQVARKRGVSVTQHGIY